MRPRTYYDNLLTGRTAINSHCMTKNSKNNKKKGRWIRNKKSGHYNARIHAVDLRCLQLTGRSIMTHNARRLQVTRPEDSRGQSTLPAPRDPTPSLGINCQTPPAKRDMHTAAQLIATGRVAYESQPMRVRTHPPVRHSYLIEMRCVYGVRVYMVCSV
jgi:hypothetical protein